MSTGAGCWFREVEPGRWKYGLQRYPYGEVDRYDEYGPFRSFAAAREHLFANHANPGGYSIGKHPTGHVHEFTGRGAQRVIGFDLAVRVQSLGPTASREEVIALVQKLDPADAAIRVREATAYDNSVPVCESCGVEDDNAGRCPHGMFRSGAGACPKCGS